MKPKNLLVYYGYPNSFNSSSNGWDNKKVAEDMAKYNLIVFGDGLQETTHADHSNLVSIVTKLKALKPDIEIFGYVTVNQSFSNFTSKVDDWKDNIGVTGIFFDEAGYDYGTSTTNGRASFNDKVDYVHSNFLTCFINSWKLQYVIGTENDTSYPNTTWNPDLLESNLNESDICLFESLAVNTLSYTNDYEAKAIWFSRIEELLAYRENYNIRFASLGVVSNSHSSGQDLFDFAYTSALMAGFDIFGTSDENYGSSSASVKFWNRINVSELDIDNLSDGATIKNSEVNSNVYHRYLEHGKMKLDFSSSSEDSEIDIF